ncbi:helix-turn-helix domain-containing protein [Undibacterium sp. Di27W]|uniref:helix-turn-helix domain-containing protein n=1 Tax=Undibacterium sp. Di27W TaxID=3413036 RepID=UPI003BF1373C
MSLRPLCYPDPGVTLRENLVAGQLPLLDVLTSPVPSGLFNSPLDQRHVLCLHLGSPVAVSYRAGNYERQGLRLHGQFCMVPAGSSTRWTLTQNAKSLLLRLTPALLADTASAMGLGAHSMDLNPAIHIRDAHIESIGWMMQAEEQDDYPGGRLFADSLATALAARLLALQTRRKTYSGKHHPTLPAWRLRQVVEYIEAHLDQDLSLAELAGVAGFSMSHFKSLFRQAAGMPVHRFVLERRLERARLLLLAGGKTMTEIALETGFSHSSHMARCMQRVLGIKPAQLRA